jgi:hypothetical protein
MASTHDDLALYVLGALEDPRGFEAHLQTCDRCRAELAELRGTLDVLDTGITRPSAPIDLRAKTFAAIRATQIDPTVQTTHREAERATTKVVSLDAARARRFRIASIAIAALLAVVAGLGYRTFTRDDFTADRTIALAAADGSAGRGEVRIDDTDAGQVVELTVSGLPDAPAGSYYECWWVGPNDADDIQQRVSAGTFTKGNGTFRMQSAADSSTYQKMGVTLEPDDGNPKRTGTKVLVSVDATGASPTTSAAPTAAVSPSVAPGGANPSPAVTSPTANATSTATPAASG